MNKGQPGKQLSPANKKLLIISLIVFFVGWILSEPSNATFGYHAISLVIKIVSYVGSLYIVSAIITGVIGKFKTHLLKVFLWLFLSASTLNLIVLLVKTVLVYSISSQIGE